MAKAKKLPSGQWRALVDSATSNWVIKTTKTVSSTRAIEMPDFVVKKFPDKGRLVPLNPDQVTRHFEKAIKDLKIQHGTKKAL